MAQKDSFHSSLQGNLAQEISIPQGKVPPNALDFERLVLGTCLIDKKGLDYSIDLLSPESFYDPKHREIFDAIKHLFATNSSVDMYTVIQELRKRDMLEKAGGDTYLVDLTTLVSSSAHIEYHVRAIQEKQILRSLIETSTSIIDDSYKDSTDVFQLLDRAEQSFFEITNGTIKKGFDTAGSLVKDALQKITSLKDMDGMSGVPSGFSAVDKETGGWQNSDLIIIAARPAMGKTAFILSMARNIAVQYNIPIAVFSLEMASVQLITRMISSETGISGEHLRKGTLSDEEWERLYKNVSSLENAPLYIDETPALSIFDFRAKCRRLVMQHGVKIIMVDYLQLMTASTSTGKSGGNREQEISTISRSLKAIAKELNVPIIALSQLSRQVESRPDKRPQLSDLRESGAIEQDADIVSFIYRPEYYKIDQWPDGTPSHDQAELIIAKHRNGSTADVRLSFHGSMARFGDLGSNFVSHSPEQEDSDFNFQVHRTAPSQAFATNDVPPTSFPAGNGLMGSSMNKVRDQNSSTADPDEQMLF